MCLEIDLLQAISIPFDDPKHVYFAEVSIYLNNCGRVYVCVFVCNVMLFTIYKVVLYTKNKSKLWSKAQPRERGAFGATNA